MGRSKFNMEGVGNRISASSINRTTAAFSKREEKAAEAFIASNPELAKAVSERPEIASFITAAVATRVEDFRFVSDRISPGRILPGLTGGLAKPPRFTFPPGLIIPPGLTLPPATGEPEQPVSPIDLEIQLLLNKIPIAHEGHIVTSEYHNTVRDALLAVADRMGLTVKAVSDLQVLSFAPNFQPIENTILWAISFNKAVVPQVVEGANAPPVVRGGFAVQLPDGAVIDSMIVRGARVAADKDKPKPKTFTVKLSRQKFDTEKPQITPLIVFDLADKKEKIKEANDVKESLPDDLDDATARTRTLDLSRVNNQTYQYFVEAIWEGDNNTAKFEIHSFQIFCET